MQLITNPPLLTADVLEQAAKTLDEPIRFLKTTVVLTGGGRTTLLGNNWSWTNFGCTSNAGDVRWNSSDDAMFHLVHSAYLVNTGLSLSNWWKWMRVNIKWLSFTFKRPFFLALCDHIQFKKNLESGISGISWYRKTQYHRIRWKVPCYLFRTNYYQQLNK